MKTKKKPETGTEVPATAAAMMAMAPVASKAWLEVIAECNRFAMERLQQDLSTHAAMMTCTSPAEVFKLQAEFIQHAVLQYSEETTRLFQMMTKATNATLAEATTGHARKYDDIPV